MGSYSVPAMPQAAHANGTKGDYTSIGVGDGQGFRQSNHPTNTLDVASDVLRALSVRRRDQHGAA